MQQRSVTIGRQSLQQASVAVKEETKWAFVPYWSVFLPLHGTLDHMFHMDWHSHLFLASCRSCISRWSTFTPVSGQQNHVFHVGQHSHLLMANSRSCVSRWSAFTPVSCQLLITCFTLVSIHTCFWPTLDHVFHVGQHSHLFLANSGSCV